MRDGITLITLLGDTLRPETQCARHRLDVNPEAALFRATAPGATELEYLSLLASLVGVFKPRQILETGTLRGDGTISLLYGAPRGAEVVTVVDSPPPSELWARVELSAAICGSRVRLHRGNTIEMIRGNAFASLTSGRCTFAFLDTRIPDRDDELFHIGTPPSRVMDFGRPCCICIHDMSKHRHPAESDAQYLPETAAAIEAWAAREGWQMLRLHQSRGMIVLTKYPS